MNDANFIGEAQAPPSEERVHVHATAIIQARTGATRLPGKVLFPLFDRSVLGHVICRLKRSQWLREVLVATTIHERDDAIVEEGIRYGVRVYRGSEMDVLGRFCGASSWTDSNWIVRITADCPLLDSDLLDRMLTELSRQVLPPDYMSNTLQRTFPRGLDVEIVRKQTLLDACHRATRDWDREHVTSYIYRHPERYCLHPYVNDVDCSIHRWTLDTEEDWDLIREVYNHLYPCDPEFGWRDVLRFLSEHPHLMQLNRDVRQKEDPLREEGALHGES